MTFKLAITLDVSKIQINIVRTENLKIQRKAAEEAKLMTAYPGRPDCHDSQSCWIFAQHPCLA